MISSRYGLISKSKVWLLIQKTFLLEHSVIPKLSSYVSYRYLVNFIFSIILLIWSLITYGMVMTWCFTFYLATFLNYFIIHNTFRWFFGIFQMYDPLTCKWCMMLRGLGSVPSVPPALPRLIDALQSAPNSYKLFLNLLQFHLSFLIIINTFLLSQHLRLVVSFAVCTLI